MSSHAAIITVLNVIYHFRRARMRQEMKIKIPRRKAPKPSQSSPAPKTKEGSAMPEELLTVGEACSIAKVSRPTMYRWLNKEGLPA